MLALDLNRMYLTMSFYFPYRLRSRGFGEVPTRATLLLMTYPLSMESVKVQLELLSFGHFGFLYLGTFARKFSNIDLDCWQSVFLS